MTRGLLDTSVFIAREGRDLDPELLPDELAVSVVTYAELRAGVLAATDIATRSRRLTTLQIVTEMNPLPSIPWSPTSGRSCASCSRSRAVGSTSTTPGSRRQRLRTVSRWSARTPTSLCSPTSALFRSWSSDRSRCSPPAGVGGQPVPAGGDGGQARAGVVVRLGRAQQFLAVAHPLEARSFQHATEDLAGLVRIAVGQPAQHHRLDAVVVQVGQDLLP